MTTLRIEHAITDYEIWKKAFDGFTEARANAGVRSFRSACRSTTRSI